MQIPNPNGQNKILGHRFGVTENVTGENVTSGKTPSASQGLSEIGHTTDARVANLRTQFDGQQIRPEVVAAAKEQLASGQLLTQASAEQTAREIIGIVEHF